MKATRCPICGLLTDPSNEYGSLLVATVGNHEATQNEEGFAQITETLICPGSGMNGSVEAVKSCQWCGKVRPDTPGTCPHCHRFPTEHDRSLDHLIYDGMGYVDRATGKVIGSVRP